MILAYRFNKNLGRICLFTVSLLLIFFIAGSEEVNAKATNIFPNKTHHGGNQGVMAVVSEATPRDCTGTCNGLNAGAVSFKVFKPAGINTDIVATLQSACIGLTGDLRSGSYSSPTGSGTLNGRMQVYIFKTTPNGVQRQPNIGSTITNTPPNWNQSTGEGCRGNDLVIKMKREAFTLAQNKRFGTDMETAIIAVDKIGGPGLKHFNVEVSGNAKVTFDDLGSGEGGKSYTNSYPGYTAFALDQLGPPPQEANYTFTFVPDCNYDPNRYIWLKWSDADDRRGQDNYDDNISWRLSGPDLSPNPITIGPGNGVLGGQGWSANSRLNIGKLQKEKKYTWTWLNVNHNNGVQLWMPFSEGGELVNCNSVVEARMSTINCDNIRGWFFYSGRKDFTNFRVRVQYRHSGTGGWTDFPSGNTAIPNRTVNSGHAPSVNHQFEMQPEGLREMFRNRYPNKIEFRLTARDLEKNRVLDLNITEEKALACPNERRAACSVTGNQVPGLPPNSGNNINVVAGRAFNLNGTFHNTGGVDLYAGPTEPSPRSTDKHNYGLRFHNNGSHRWGKPEWALFAANPNGWVEAGDSRAIPINDLMAPNSPGSYTINFQPDHFGWFTEGGFRITNCPVNIHVYEEYRFNTSASRNNPDIENPTQINYGGGVSQVTPNPHKPITAVVRYGLTLEGVGQVSGATDGPRGFRGSVPYSGTYNVPNPQLGQKYCATLRMSIGGGSPNIGQQAVAYVGPSGAIYPAQDGVADDCYRIENRPYVRTYGGDIASGGGFLNTPSSCGRGNGGSQIKTNMRPFGEQETQNKSGSGSQLAAMALGNISGFMSATLRNTDPVAPKGLTFAHEGNAAPDDSLSPLLGGNMSGNGWCVPDFFESTQFPDDHSGKDKSESRAAINVLGLPKGGQTVRNNIGSNPLTLTGFPLPVYSSKHTVYVDGDVFIRDNIMYTNSYAAGTDLIPSFTLVVRGNIYINSSVTQLDGLYIAQPAEGRQNTGHIYTCANSSGPIRGAEALFNTCGANTPNPPQLRVNGAFIAERVVLNRTGYTLRDSKFRELANDSKAAEIFNFSPEMYLSPPVFRPNSTPTSGDYDYISILAPTL